MSDQAETITVVVRYTRDSPNLHGKRFAKFQGSTDKSFALISITAQFQVELWVGQMNVFQAGKFNLKFFNLLEGEVRIAGVGLAAKNLAHKERERAFVWEHSVMQNMAGQFVAKLPPGNHALRVTTGI